MSATNAQVIQAFLARKPRQGANLSTDGQSLWSYHWWQMAYHYHSDSNTPPCVIVREGPAYSVSTARQRSLLFSLINRHNYLSTMENHDNPIVVIKYSDDTPRMLGHMKLSNLTEAERIANGGFSTEHYRSTI